METARVHVKLNALRSLADHPATSSFERDNALRRISELEQTIQDGELRTRVRRGASGEKKRRTLRKGALRTVIRRRKKKIDPGLPVKWPFWWDGSRQPVAYKEMDSADGGYVLVWECPHCGGSTVRRISPKERKQLNGRKGAFEERVKFFTDGYGNQLCQKCWKGK